MSLIDSHCHLDRFDAAELPDLLDRAQAAGVTGMVTIGTRLSEAPRQIALARRSRPDLPVWCTLGTHPDHVHEEELPGPDVLAGLVEAPGVVGIGESGLDYFHGTPEVRPAQQDSFRLHLRAARATGLPLVIHARDADDDMIGILRDEHEQGGAFPFLLHCFSSGLELARAGVALGGSISFSGILTFPKSQALRDIAAGIPADRLLVETDAPYLAPVPWRGRRNEPAHVSHTAAMLASVRDLEPAALGDLTTANFFRLFSRAAR
ncbi:TatD family hydrolase [Lichenicoccus roseus]|uniref:TatD family deoxyribonuclease n=1 Tax=Lichenicoccus roseus TaxID=2683649 RepID=A0A5R9JAN3_9PROT|nr:TatD family hydrolase [Lichenicoccus roseus]TLU72661.1 TatD family deoxyribonuclease [Lichenicoccus roseus]